MTEPQTLARQIGSYASQQRFSDLPRHIQLEAPRAFLNWLGCAYGGCRAEVVNALLDGDTGALERGPCPTLGRSERLSLTSAALVNCVSSSVHAFDDTHLETITHPTGPVAAACLALASEYPVDGASFYAALLIGMEIECRLSSALMSAENPADRAAIGWMMTGVSGGVGAAVASAMLLGLNAEEIASAIGIAAVQAGGFRSAHGSMTMPLVPGLAARNGLSAALWARAGLTCTDHSLEGPNGFFDVFAPSAARSGLCREFGEYFALTGNSYKPYPCGIVIHPAIDACRDLYDRQAIAPDQIERVELDVHPLTVTLADRVNPDNEFVAQVSTQFCIAVVLITGNLKLQHLNNEWFDRPDVRALQKRIVLKADDTLGRDRARARIVFKDSSQIHGAIEHARGSTARPMSVAELVDKFQSQAEPIIGATSAGQIVETLMSDDVPALDKLVSILR